jgi:zinc protease
MSLRDRRYAIAAAFAIFLAASASILSAQAAPGQETSAASVASYGLDQSMPADPDALIGALPNGLRYYVRANAKPAHRAELRLVVKAGSVLEDDDQQGLAHFVEHMEFEGTRHFPGQGIVQFLGSLGLSIGADANAATSYDDTQYTLRVPTDVPGVLDRALLVLEDWAGAATFDETAIERERGIVYSEWRMNLGADERIADKIRRVQLEGSRYADRSPIGKPDSIERAQREQLVRYYRDWYRPDLMAVIVVGDVDRDAVVAMIRAHFSSLASPSPARPRPIFDAPEHPGTKYAVLTDKETTATAVELSDLRPARNQGTVGGYRDLIRDQLFSGMLTARLAQLTQTANPPFFRASANRGLFPAPRSRDAAALGALVAGDGVTRGLDALVTELQRVVRLGFTTTEFDRARQAMMRDYERAVTQSPDRESESRADEYTRNFLQSEALPTIWQELAFHRRFLPEITLSEVNALAADWFPANNRLIIVAGPEAAGIVLPDQAQLESVVLAASAKRVEPYADDAAGKTLIDAPPPRGSIVGTGTPAAGITEWTLSNGARVVLKPTTLKQDQILFRATAPGGTSIASDADLIPARVADDVIPAGGVGRYSAAMLDRILAGTAAGVAPFINDTNEGMRGGSTPQDLETMFQLLYLRFTQPRADPIAFAAMAAEAKALLANRAASPDVVFNQTLDSILTRNSPRRQFETPATVDQWNLEKSLAFYRARFADASNFTFIFVGSFTLDAIKPLVETYIASLPATHARESWQDRGIVPPTGVIEKTVEKGIAPKSQVAIVFSGPFTYDAAHRLALDTMARVLQGRLFDTIRQELGGTYSITATPAAGKIPRPEFRIRIEWTCDPQRTAALVQRVFEEVSFIKTTRLVPEQMARLRDGLLRDYEVNSQENRYALEQIARRYQDGDSASLGDIDAVPARIAALTPEAIQQAAQTYLDTANYVKVTLMPETK